MPTRRAALVEEVLETLHNPDRFMADLRQILSQGRKRIGLLVGAGAPLALKDEAGAHLIPGIDELTKKVVASLEGQLGVAALAIRTDLGNGGNIETILSRVRLLKEVLATTVVHGLDSAGYNDLGTAICKKIGALVSVTLPSGRNAYTELISWISNAQRTHAVEVFTTNYDLLFEEAFERAKAPYFDGFTGGNAPFFDPVTVAGDDLPPRWSRLWKLHGSIGWALEAGIVVRGRGRTATQLVYPDHLKYDLTQKQPYSALFERLKRFLLTPDSLLLAIGFSFRDAHVCAVLDEALGTNANTAVFSFQFRGLTDEGPVCRLASDHPNLSVYAADGAVIGGVAGSWHPGEMPRNWEDIRASFWGPRHMNEQPVFLLGDFARFARFCALAQSTDLLPAVEITMADAAETSIVGMETI
jgi:SIR2-like domain